jgi:hypothetical protein
LLFPGNLAISKNGESCWFDELRALHTNCFWGKFLKKLLLALVFSVSIVAEATQLQFKLPNSGSSFYLTITAVAISDKGIEFATEYEKTVCIVDDTILDKANISGLELIEKIQSKAWENVTILCQKIQGQWVATRITSSVDF